MTSELAILLDQNRNEIAVSWAISIYKYASFHPEKNWLDALYASTTRGLAAFIVLLDTGANDSMQVYLRELSEVTLQSGFESGEVTGSLLLLKDSVMQVISRIFPTDTAKACALISVLNEQFIWIVRHFSMLYSTEINRQLREQHERIVTMLQMGQHSSGQPELDEMLHHIAERIISALHVNHCDFYLVSEESTVLIPKVGVSRIPHDKQRVALFLNYPPNTAEDPFYQYVLECKKPVVVNDIGADSRINREINILMDTKSLLVVPLITQGRVVAIAVTGTFGEYRAFTEDQVELAWDIARAAALVIENARMSEKIRYMAVLEERERLAREIHDNLAQTLSMVNLQTSHIDSLLTDGSVDQAQSFLKEMKDMVIEAHVDARDAIFSLRIGSSSTQEFMRMLFDYLERYRSNYKVNAILITHTNVPIMLSLNMIIQLTRIIQEALTNVRKHADSDKVWVELERVTNRLIISIRDNGRGFDLAKIENKTHEQVGLQVMRERTESLGGQMRIDTAPGDGTTITIDVPLPT